MVDCGLSNVLINSKWPRVNDKFNPEIKSESICLTLPRKYKLAIIRGKLKILRIFTVNYKTVGKIAVSISKAAVLVSARKTTPPIRCNVDFDQFKGYQKNKINRSCIIRLSTFNLKKIKENQIKSWFHKRLLEINSRCW